MPNKNILANFRTKQTQYNRAQLPRHPPPNKKKIQSGEPQSLNYITFPFLVSNLCKLAELSVNLLALVSHNFSETATSSR